MLFKKKKPKIKKLKDTAKSRRMRSLTQKFFVGLRILVALFIFALIGLSYLNLDKIYNQVYKLTANLGFTLENITIEGQKFVNNDLIAQELKLKKGMSIFAVSLDSVKSRLEEIQWVKYAIVERELPHSIHIYIVERTPIALGQKDKKLYIIDDEGAIINEKDLDKHLELPIIIGDGAEIYANSLINILKEDPELFKKIDAIIHVSERRWNVRFDNDLEIKLPEENIELAWKKVIKLYNNKELFSPDISAIDLRIANKIYVEKK